MAEALVDWNIYTNPNKTRAVKTKMVEDGKLVDVEMEVYGVDELGYVDPDTKGLVFASDVDGAPKQPGNAPAGKPKTAKAKKE